MGWPPQRVFCGGPFFLTITRKVIDMPSAKTTETLFSRRTTLRDIAHTAGIHYATVSRALKDSPLIAAKTRERIQKIAREMGYVPDPMLSALTAYRSAVSPEHFRATLAWVTNGFERGQDRGSETFNLYFEGARERAASFGYTLEEFWLREPGMNWRRNSEVLLARGITGLILAPQPKPKMRVRLDWTRFSTVAMGYSTFSPYLHIVTNDQFHSMTTVVRNVRSRGYRRIALWLWGRSSDERIDRGWTGGFLAQRQHWSPGEQLPIFYVHNEGGCLRDWIEQYRPDVILGDEHMVPIILDAGYRIPEDIGFASYVSLNRNCEKICGIDENPVATGAAAIDLLVSMINCGERGIPKIHQRILIEGTWINGTSLRSLRTTVEAARTAQV
jgi:LacI family transcriptional regulator